MSIRRVMTLGVVVALAAFLVWSIARPPAAAKDIDARAREIASGLRCPVCQNLSVADSPSALATEMRATIRSKVAAGESRAEIVRFFTDRYGTWIVFEPPARGIGIVPWLAPVIALLAGASFAAVAARRWRRSPGGSIEPADREKLVEALARYRDDDDPLEP